MSILVKDNPLVRAPSILAKDLNFPLLQIRTANLYTKNGSSGIYASTDANFWATDDYLHDYATAASVGAIFTSANDTQVIVDISGESGILTHVVSPEVDVNNDITITIERDGVATVYLAELTVGSSRAVMGGCKPGMYASVSNAISDNSMFGSYNDYGFTTYSGTSMLLIHPDQALYEGIGLPYENSLKVTIGATGAAATTYSRYAMVKFIRRQSQ